MQVGKLFGRSHSISGVKSVPPRGSRWVQRESVLLFISDPSAIPTRRDTDVVNRTFLDIPSTHLLRSPKFRFSSKNIELEQFNLEAEPFSLPVADFTLLHSSKRSNVSRYCSWNGL